MKPLLVVGDALLDRDVTGSVRRVCPDAPVPVLDEEQVLARPGGAALAAALAAADGREVTLLSAFGDDPAGRQLAQLLRARGVELIDLGLRGATPEKVRLRSAGQSLLRLDRGGEPAEIDALSAAGRAAIGWAEAILVADYGRGLCAQSAVRCALARVAGEKPLVWDPHPRGASPVEGTLLVTPNEAEAGASMGADVFTRIEMSPRGDALVTGADPSIAGVWHVCVTRGAAGAALYAGGRLSTRIPAPQIGDGDPCGAGDRFSSAVAGALADGMPLLEAIRAGVASASAFVCAGGATAWFLPERQAVVSRTDDPIALAAQVRARGGTVVAAGGCFDLLHSGHVRMLEAARALGDCLIVCLNSDASVRRLKGPSRPLVAQGDRTTVLAALRCVDAVLVFDRDTPERAIEQLRPHVWAKGGDYSVEELPERKVLERWSGRVATLPYLDGHSTSGLLKEVAFRVAS